MPQGIDMPIFFILCVFAKQFDALVHKTPGKTLLNLYVILAIERFITRPKFANEPQRFSMLVQNGVDRPL